MNYIVSYISNWIAIYFVKDLQLSIWRHKYQINLSKLYLQYFLLYCEDCFIEFHSAVRFLGVNQLISSDISRKLSDCKSVH